MNKPMDNCPEPNRAACPRLCADFCHATEVMKSVDQRRLVMPLRDCHDCRYCGPDRPEGMILCNHESWIHWDEEMRVFAPDFAPECDSFDAKLSRHNADVVAPPSQDSDSK